MKKIILYTLLITIFTFYQSKIFCQDKSINCLIFIDNKIPDCLYILNSYFTYETQENTIDTVRFNYTIGDIVVSEENLIKINSIRSKYMKIHFTNRELINNIEYYYYYEGQFITESFQKCGYFIFRIKNINKKKRKYLFGYDSCWGATILRKHEENIINYQF